MVLPETATAENAPFSDRNGNFQEFLRTSAIAPIYHYSIIREWHIADKQLYCDQCCTIPTFFKINKKGASPAVYSPASAGKFNAIQAENAPCKNTAQILCTCDEWTC